MMYAFSIGEAQTLFREAASIDPRAAMPYWGQAVAETFDINAPTTPDGENRGAAAIEQARLRAANASADERALIEAAAPRFSTAGSPESKYRAFRDAMRRYADAHPLDADGATVAALAGYLASNGLTTADGAPNADAERIRVDLENAVALDPANLGAHHLLIHFWEYAGHAERALPDANYLFH